MRAHRRSFLFGASAFSLEYLAPSALLFPCSNISDIELVGKFIEYNGIKFEM